MSEKENNFQELAAKIRKEFREKNPAHHLSEWQKHMMRTYHLQFYSKLGEPNEDNPQNKENK